MHESVSRNARRNNSENAYQKIFISNQESGACNRIIALVIRSNPESIRAFLSGLSRQESSLIQLGWVA